jgi:hypothetical protein
MFPVDSIFEKLPAPCHPYGDLFATMGNAIRFTLYSEDLATPHDPSITQRIMSLSLHERDG